MSDQKFCCDFTEPDSRRYGGRREGDNGSHGGHHNHVPRRKPVASPLRRGTWCLRNKCCVVISLVSPRKSKPQHTHWAIDARNFPRPTLRQKMSTTDSSATGRRGTEAINIHPSRPTLREFSRMFHVFLSFMH